METEEEKMRRLAMGNDLKSLRDMWEEGNSNYFIAVSENGTVVNIVGVTDVKAYGWVDDNENVKTFDLDRVHWLEYTPPKDVAHWRAVKFSQTPNHGDSKGASYCLSHTLYATEKIAKRNNGRKFIRLAKEYPPIMLPPSMEEQAVLEEI